MLASSRLTLPSSTGFRAVIFARSAASEMSGVTATTSAEPPLSLAWNELGRTSAICGPPTHSLVTRFWPPNAGRTACRPLPPAARSVESLFSPAPRRTASAAAVSRPCAVPPTRMAEKSFSCCSFAITSTCGAARPVPSASWSATNTFSAPYAPSCAAWSATPEPPTNAASGPPVESLSSRAFERISRPTRRKPLPWGSATTRMPAMSLGPFGSESGFRRSSSRSGSRGSAGRRRPRP